MTLDQPNGPHDAIDASIPLYILSRKGPLTDKEAICVYLCLDPDGPRLTHAAAATALGLRQRQEVGTYISRAREAAGDTPLPWRATTARERRRARRGLKRR